MKKVKCYICGKNMGNSLSTYEGKPTHTHCKLNKEPKECEHEFIPDDQIEVTFTCRKCGETKDLRQPQETKVEWKEMFDEEFKYESSEFCGCYEGDLGNNYPEGKEKLFKFIANILEQQRRELLDKLQDDRYYEKKDILELLK